jgi:hypothetical protein
MGARPESLEDDSGHDVGDDHGGQSDDDSGNHH